VLHGHASTEEIAKFTKELASTTDPARKESVGESYAASAFCHYFFLDRDGKVIAANSACKPQRLRRPHQKSPQPGKRYRLRSNYESHPRLEYP